MSTLEDAFRSAAPHTFVYQKPPLTQILRFCERWTLWFLRLPTPTALLSPSHPRTSASHRREENGMGRSHRIARRAGRDVKLHCTFPLVFLIAAVSGRPAHGVEGGRFGALAARRRDTARPPERRFRDGPWAYALGVFLALIGGVLLVLPGPGLPVFAAGLALLAPRHAWAEALLNRLKRALGRFKSR